MKAPIVLILFILSYQGATAQRENMLAVEPFSLLQDSIFHWKMTEIEKWYFQLAESDENVSAFSYKTDIGERIVHCVKTLEYGLVEHICIFGEEPLNSFKEDKFRWLELTIESAGTAKRLDRFYSYNKDMIRGSKIIRNQKFWWNYYFNCFFYLNQVIDLNTFRSSSLARKRGLMSFLTESYKISLNRFHYDLGSISIRDHIVVSISKL